VIQQILGLTYAVNLAKGVAMEYVFLLEKHVVVE
jgi:hypothetical protein